MTKDHALAFLAANYPVFPGYIQEYVERAEQLFSEDYWTREIITDEALTADFNLFLEAKATQRSFTGLSVSMKAIPEGESFHEE